MIADVELPEVATALDARARQLSTVVSGRLGDRAKTVELLAGDDLLSDLPAGHLFVDDGFISCMQGDRLVRYFESGLFVSVCPGSTLRYASEFCTRGRFYDAEAFQAALRGDADLLVAWLDHEAVGQQLLACICAAHTTADSPMRPDLRRVPAGELLVVEGQFLREVLVLVDGRAQAEAGGLVVGEVYPTEFIGEVSFLTQTACNASVRALTDCCVQAIPKETFSQVIRHRPQTMVQLATTLAERLTRANRQFPVASPPTVEAQQRPKVQQVDRTSED